MQDKSLWQMLMNEHNRFVESERLADYANICNKLMMTLGLTFVIGGLLSAILTNFTSLYIYISYNEYASLILGNICFYFAILLLKNKLFFYHGNNPITIVGIIYPAFFNAKALSLIFENLLNINVSFYAIFLILSIIIYYLILNRVYLKESDNNVD